MPSPSPKRRLAPLSSARQPKHTDMFLRKQKQRKRKPLTEHASKNALELLGGCNE
mgnify:CR=1